MPDQLMSLPWAWGTVCDQSTARRCWSEITALIKSLALLTMIVAFEDANDSRSVTVKSSPTSMKADRHGLTLTSSSVKLAAHSNSRMSPALNSVPLNRRASRWGRSENPLIESRLCVWRDLLNPTGRRASWLVKEDVTCRECRWCSWRCELWGDQAPHHDVMKGLRCVELRDLFTWSRDTEMTNPCTSTIFDRWVLKRPAERATEDVVLATTWVFQWVELKWMSNL